MQPSGSGALPGRPLGDHRLRSAAAHASRKRSRARVQPTRCARGSRSLVNAITSFSNRPLIYIFQLGVAVMAAVDRGRRRPALPEPDRAHRRAGLGVDHGVDLVPRRADDLLHRRHRHVSGEGVHGNQAAALHHRPRRIRRRAATRRDPRRACATSAPRLLRSQAARRTARRRAAWTGIRRSRRSCASASSHGCGRTSRTPAIVDYGCGYGALAAYLRGRGHQGPVPRLRRQRRDDRRPRRAHVARSATAGSRRSRDELHRGRLRGRQRHLQRQAADAGDAEWRRRTCARPSPIWRALGARGFGFNALTLYSDADKRRPDLYYADPLELFDHCKRTYSRFVTLLHDYPLYEFTLLVRRVTHMASLVIFGAGDIARLAHFYFTTDSAHEVAGVRRRRRLPHGRHVPRPAAVRRRGRAVARYPPGEYAMFVALSYARMNRAARREVRGDEGGRLPARELRQLALHLPGRRRRRATTASSSRTTRCSRS